MKTPHIIKVFGYMYELHKRNFISYFKPTRIPNHSPILENSVHWVGHATTIINVHGKLLITDPVTSMYLGELKRQVKPSLDVSKIHFDYILLSHGHMDHMDFNTLRKINKDAVVLCPKNYKHILKLLQFRSVIEVRPKDKFKDNILEIDVLEANHDGRRYYIGNNSVSNAYLITASDKRIFFSGDTAYTENFKNLKADIAIMPVGCYTPDEFREMHCSPKECYTMFKSMEIPFMIPIHYKTYILSQDDENSTLNTLSSFNDTSIKIIDVGETVKF